MRCRCSVRRPLLLPCLFPRCCPVERVKVFVRVRPTKPEGETPGAVKAKPDGKGLVIFRECVWRRN